MPPINTLSKTRVAAILSSLLTVNIHAATVEVTSHLDDNGAGCTFREAIDFLFNDSSEFPDVEGCTNSSTNPLGTDDLIRFSDNLPSNTIVLANREIELQETKVSINAGNISGGITLSANGQFRVMSIYDEAEVTLNNLTFSGGEVAGYATSFGGGLAIQDSAVVLQNCTVTNNTASRGAGIDIQISAATKQSSLLLNNSIVSNNTSTSGGGAAIRAINDFSSVPKSAISITLENSLITNNTSVGDAAVFALKAKLNINNTSIEANTSTQRGGGLFIDGADLTLTNSTVSANFNEGSSGGGLYAGKSASYENSVVSVTNSTISGNSARNKGGGIHSAFGTELSLSNSTIAGNSAGASGAGLYVLLSTADLKNSIIANSQGSSDCDQTDGNITVDSATIIEDGGCGASRSGDPGLLPLADNGGPTLTHALSANSIARNSSNALCAVEDQRGQIRRVGDGFCDVGAFEFIEGLDDVEDSSFFVVPLKNGKSVIFEL